MVFPNEKMASANEVMATLDIKSKTTLRAMIERDAFPKPYEITKGKRHWAMSEVQSWLHRRMAAQRGVAA
jgi:predicted DNA-binding transcriptional regulator AlpA